MKIFLSYATPDRERADAVRMLLELGGASVFMDWRSIRLGEDWKQALERALQECDVLCVFWSSATPQSKWVSREYETFIRVHPERPCVPLRADETPLPPLLAERQAPQEFPALANEFLALRRRLLKEGVSREDAERLVRQRLVQRGLTLNDRQWKKLSVLFFGGGFSLALLLQAVLQFFQRSWLPKLTAALLALFGLTIFGWRSCQGETRKASELIASTLRDSSKPGAQGGTAPGAPGHGVTPEVIPVEPRPPVIAPEGQSRDDVPAEEDRSCLQRFGAKRAELPIEDNAVANRDSALCGFLDAAFRVAQRDFRDVTVEPGTYEDGRQQTANFPLCRPTTVSHTGRWPPGKIVWRSKLTYSDSGECEVVRFSLKDLENKGEPTSMFLQCKKKNQPLSKDTLQEFEKLRESVALCLTPENGWMQSTTDRLTPTLSGGLNLHGSTNGIARTYFERATQSRSWKMTVELGPDDYNRPTYAELSLSIALGREK